MARSTIEVTFLEPLNYWSDKVSLISQRYYVAKNVSYECVYLYIVCVKQYWILDVFIVFSFGKLEIAQQFIASYSDPTDSSSWCEAVKSLDLTIFAFFIDQKYSFVLLRRSLLCPIRLNSVIKWRGINRGET